jgi:hypothetical protein
MLHGRGAAELGYACSAILIEILRNMPPEQAVELLQRAADALVSNPAERGAGQVAGAELITRELIPMMTRSD